MCIEFDIFAFKRTFMTEINICLNICKSVFFFELNTLSLYTVVS